MKKILFAAMICCVATMGLTLSSCEKKNEPTPESKLEAIDPYLVWGGNYADVQKHIEAKAWWKDGNQELEYWAGAGWHKWYLVADSLTEQYIFETQEGENLLSVQCYCYDKTITIADARICLEKRGYIYLSDRNIGEGDEVIKAPIYMSADKQTRVYIIPYMTDYWYFYFSPMPSAN